VGQVFYVCNGVVRKRKKYHAFRQKGDALEQVVLGVNVRESPKIL